VRPFGNRDSVFAKFLHNHLHDFTDVPEGFLLGVAPCCGAVPVERRTMGMQRPSSGSTTTLKV
jgi:hypothetical protein